MVSRSTPSPRSHNPKAAINPRCLIAGEAGTEARSTIRPEKSPSTSNFTTPSRLGASLAATSISTVTVRPPGKRSGSLPCFDPGEAKSRTRAPARGSKDQRMGTAGPSGARKVTAIKSESALHGQGAASIADANSSPSSSANGKALTNSSKRTASFGGSSARPLTQPRIHP